MANEWLFHDSHDLFYRNPFGAVTCDTPVICRLKVSHDQEPQGVFLKLCGEDGVFHSLAMQIINSKQNERFYEATIKGQPRAGLLWYYFAVILEGNTYYYGNNLGRLGGVGLIQEQVPPSYQLTVYSENLKVPAWFSHGVIYQIFPDRFYNGLPQGQVLNPKPNSMLYSCWHDTPLYIRDPRSNAILCWDFFGGNLEGVMRKLPYLNELGVTIIYFNPIFEASSNHRYDTGDYRKVDPMLGTNDTFRQLCAKCEELGIRVILDGVFSHTGSDSIYFNREGRYPGTGAFQSKDSPYYNWYRFSYWPNSYESWWGIGTLPNVNEMEPGYQEFILGPEGVARHWLALGAKGWRLDVADELPDRFIKKLRQAVKEEDSDSVIIGEVWEDASNKVSYGERREYLWGEELDSVMNYPFRSIMLDFILCRRDAAETDARLRALAENYPSPVFYSLMNLIGSHDVPRILTLLGEGRGDHLHEVEKRYYRLNPDQRMLAIARLKLLVLIQMTFPGVPAVYYGDEAGMEGYADPFNRGAYPWGREDKSLLSWYKKAIALRKDHEAVQMGSWRAIYARGDVYGYLRLGEKEVIAAFFNRHPSRKISVVLDISDWSGGIWEDLLEPGLMYSSGPRTELYLNALEGKVLRLTNMNEIKVRENR